MSLGPPYPVDVLQKLAILINNFFAAHRILFSSLSFLCAECADYGDRLRFVY